MFLFRSGRQEREEDEKRMSRWVYLMLSNSDLIWNKESISSLSCLFTQVSQRHPHWPKAACTQLPRVSTFPMHKSRNTKDVKIVLHHSSIFSPYNPPNQTQPYSLLYFSKWFIFIQILELNILSAILAALWSSKHMLGTVLGSVYTMMKKTKVIPNFMEFFWWGRQIMNKETNTCTKL